MYIYHTENKNLKYVITLIERKPKFVIEINSLNLQTEFVYLTDFQIVLRMGWIISYINGEFLVNQFNGKIDDSKKFILIDKNNNKNSLSLKEQLNPCSIDLHICEQYFCKKNRK